MSSLSDANTATVFAFMDAMAARDLDAMKRHLVDEPVWRVLHSEHRGMAGVEWILNAASNLYRSETLEREIQAVVADDDRVVVQSILRGQTAAGDDYENYYVFIAEMTDGRIAVIWEYLNTAYANEKFAGLARD